MPDVEAAEGSAAPLHPPSPQPLHRIPLPQQATSPPPRPPRRMPGLCFSRFDTDDLRRARSLPPPPLPSFDRCAGIKGLIGSTALCKVVDRSVHPRRSITSETVKVPGEKSPSVSQSVSQSAARLHILLASSITVVYFVLIWGEKNDNRLLITVIRKVPFR